MNQNDCKGEKDQKGEEMGKMVAQMFLKCEEESTKLSACEKITLLPELIIRNSSILNK